ncbi:hypothetical protein PT300_13465 [Enterobacteriaceae bacterium ESL0689]|nr:hypothetical protein [Enterobacteriaceae bacterium ESL0689]
METISDFIVSAIAVILVIVILSAITMGSTILIVGSAIIAAGSFVCYFICRGIAYIKEREEEHLNKRGAE